MRISKKTLVAIAVVLLGFVLWCLYDPKLRGEYIERLNEQEAEYIDAFYQSTVYGVISYIKKYEDSPSKYVIAVRDTSGFETTIGKVEISNFSSVKEGDSIRKKSETFQLIILSSGQQIASEVKYE